MIRSHIFLLLTLLGLASQGTAQVPPTQPLEGSYTTPIGDKTGTLDIAKGPSTFPQIYYGTVGIQGEGPIAAESLFILEVSPGHYVWQNARGTTGTLEFDANGDLVSKVTSGPKAGTTRTWTRAS